MTTDTLAALARALADAARSVVAEANFSLTAGDEDQRYAEVGRSAIERLTAAESALRLALLRTE